MSRIASQDQMVGRVGARVAETCGHGSGRANSASIAGAYPPLSAAPPPPGRARPHFCLPPCCDLSTLPMRAEAREKETGAEIRAGGSQGAGRPARRLRARGALALLLLMALGTAAAAHGWYPWECCSDRDCYAVPKERVRVIPGGWLIDGFTVLHQEVRPSPDGQFHICRTQDGKGDLIRPHMKPACAWAPVVGS